MLCLPFGLWSKTGGLGSLQKELADFAADKAAGIGIALISQTGDTMAVNGSEEFPMLSVYKFPQALDVATTSGLIGEISRIIATHFRQ